MDALTLSLTVLGIAGVAFFAYAAYVEIKKGGRPKSPGVPSIETGTESTQIRGQRPAPAPVVARVSSPEPAAQEEVAAAVSAAASEPVVPVAPSVPETSEGPSADQERALARIAVMQADFDRDAALAVAQCGDADFELLVSNNLIAFDPDRARYSVPSMVRGPALRALSAEETVATRLRYAEYYLELAQLTQPVSRDGGTHAVAGAAVLDTERDHFAAAFEFLSAEPDRAGMLLELVNAAERTHGVPLDPTEAVRWYEAAVAAAHILGNRAGERDALIALGSALSSNGEQGRAREYHEKALALSEELGDRLAAGRSLGNIALTWHRAGEFAKAIEYYEQILVIMREVGDKSREAMALIGLGQACVESGDHDRAMDCFSQMREMAIQVGDRRGEAVALTYLGLEQMRVGKVDVAITLFEHQLDIGRTMRDLAGEGEALGRLGLAYRSVSKHDKAIECYTRQVEIAHLLRDPKAGVRAMGDLGLENQAIDRTSKALECFEEQLRVARRFNDREGEAVALMNGARVVHSQGQVVEAVTRASAALPIFEAIKSPDLEKIRAEIDEWRAHLSH